MKIHSFSLTIPEGKESSEGYVNLQHATQYTLRLANDTDLRCDVEVYIDGGHAGTWRIEKRSLITIERPVHDTGRFTFYQAGTPDAQKAGIVVNENTGHIRAIFKPEHSIKDVIRWSRRDSAGGTGLSGHSEQSFKSVQALDYDLANSVTINLRLVTSNLEPRPLFPKSNPIPPPIL